MTADPDVPGLYAAPFEEQIEAFIDQHRAMLAGCLEGLSEAEVRRRSVSSKTTLLGLVKHATFVEGVWFGEAPTGRTREELALPAGPDESFDLTEADTIASVLDSFARACEHSRRVMGGVGGDVRWAGNRRGELSVRWILLHVLREHAQHCGHADILREQVLMARDRTA